MQFYWSATDSTSLRPKHTFAGLFKRCHLISQWKTHFTLRLSYLLTEQIWSRQNVNVAISKSHSGNEKNYLKYTKNLFEQYHLEIGQEIYCRNHTEHLLFTFPDLVMFVIYNNLSWNLETKGKQIYFCNLPLHNHEQVNAHQIQVFNTFEAAVSLHLLILTTLIGNRELEKKSSRVSYTNMSLSYDVTDASFIMR